MTGAGAGLRCAVGKCDNPRATIVQYVCHHCGRPLCDNDGEWAKAQNKRVEENRCVVYIGDDAFPPVGKRKVGTAESVSLTKAYHCPDCAKNHEEADENPFVVFLRKLFRRKG